MSTDVRNTRDFDEEGFHEIQLSGKQLVFLCMATTVVSIVIFLCGVLVGRGVRPVETIAEASTQADTSVTEPATPPPASSPASAPGVLAKPGTTPAPVANTAKPTPPPPAAVEEPTPVPDSAPEVDNKAASAAKHDAKPPVTPAPAAAAPKSAANSATPPAVKPDTKAHDSKADLAKAESAKKPAAAAAPAAAPAATATPPATDAAKAATKAGGNGVIAVQVGALRGKAEAESLARKLSGKGYPTYIVSPDAGTSNPVYKVRVGNYSSQDEAERVKRRLQQEEKLSPWITH